MTHNINITVTEEDALDGLIDAVRFAEAQGHDELARDIGACYQRLDAALVSEQAVADAEMPAPSELETIGMTENDD